MNDNGRTAVLRTTHNLLRPIVFLPLLALLSLLALPGTYAGNCDNPKVGYGYTCSFNEGLGAKVDIWCPWADNSVYLLAFINATREIAQRSQETEFIITVKSWEGAKLNGRPYSVELQEAIKSGNAPTVFALGSTWLSYFINSSVLYDLTAWGSQWDYLNKTNYSPLVTVELLWARSTPIRWYAVPIATDTNVLVLNKRALELAKVQLADVQDKDGVISWESFFNLTKVLNNTQTGKYGYGLVENYEYSTRILIPYLFDTTNTSIIGKDGKCALDNDAAKGKLEEFVSIFRDGYAPNPIDCYNSSKDLNFSHVVRPDGGVAMMSLPPNHINRSSDAFVTATLPLSFLGGVGMAINKNAPPVLQELGWQFIQTLVEKYMKQIALDTLSPPPFYNKSTGVYYSPWNDSNSLNAASNKAVLQGIDLLHPNTSLPYSFELEGEKLFRCMLDNVINKKQSINKAVKTLCREVDNTVKNYCALNAVCPRVKEGKGKGRLIVGLAVGLSAFTAIVVAVAIFILCRREDAPRYVRSLRTAMEHTKFISHREIVIATNNFNVQNLLGKGGFGTVYKGVMPNGKVVAVKLLIENTDGEEEFLNEIETISTIHHRNLVSVEGFCLNKGRMMLVYDYMQNGSLEDAIFGGRLRLTWRQTFGIIMGTANGINYLHTACQQKIIHRDIKPANILLDDHLVARVADFGMAKNTSLENTHVSTRIMGTLGYLDPNYSLSGQLTEKSDVYSFGVVMLVVVLGRKPFDPEQVEPGNSSSKVPLVEWVRFVQDKALDKVRQRYPGDINEEEARRCILVTGLCIQTFPDARPSMSQVLQMLKGEMSIPILPPKEYTEDSFIPEYESSCSMKTNNSATNNSDFMLGSIIAPSHHPSEDMSILKVGR